MDDRAMKKTAETDRQAKSIFSEDNREDFGFQAVKAFYSRLANRDKDSVCCDPQNWYIRIS